MAKLSWTVETSAGTVTHDGPTLTDAQMQRFLDWVWATERQLEPDGTPKPRTLANVTASVRDWGRSQWRDTKTDVRKYEANAAAQAARNSVADLP